MPRRKKEGLSSESTHYHKSEKLEEKVIQNIIELQKINIKMIEKFDKLTEQVSQLLSLFEMTAKTFTEHPENQVSEKDKEFLQKIDKLLEQNKTIAKGLIMMEERIKEKTHNPQQERPLNRPMPQMKEENQENNFQPSISNRPLPKF